MKRALILAGLAGAVLLVAAAVGCAGHSAKKTSLKLVADDGLGSKAVFHLRCDPPGGDIADPASACARLAEHPDALLHPAPFNCFAGTWDITISGSFQGRPVDVKTATCWTSQMELIDRLGIARQLETHLVGISKAEANVRAAVTAISAYYRDHGTYVGMSADKLRETYDAGLKLDPIDSALLGKNRFCVQSTVRGRIASENWPPLQTGEIADKPCG